MTSRDDSDAPRAVNLVRRRLLIGSAVAGIGGAAAAIHDGELGAPPRTFRGAVPWQEGTADAPPGVSGTGYVFFAPAEAGFIEAAVGRLIPSDEVGPGAVEANVPFFLDRQLAGKFGRGDHYFLGGPWPKGTPEQGYQSRFSPAEYYRAAIAAIDKYSAENFNGSQFRHLGAENQDKVLKGLESGEIKLDGGVDSKTFFAMLLQNTKEGYFSDPIYGGNKDMGAWKMIGFPGAHYDYKEWVSRHGERVPYPTVGFKGRPGWKEVEAMATTLKPVDAVLVGFGWTGAIMGQELCEAGLNVLALERGPWRDTATDFATGFAQDELRYMWRHHLFQNVADDTLTIRNNVNQEALPMRHLGAFLLGTGVGSGGVHWNGQIWRFLPSDFKTKSHNQQRYGKKSVTDHDLTVQDWGTTYEELEPFYDQFDKLCGTSGKAGNLKGLIQPGGNPFEGPRSSEYPTPPMTQTYAPTLFGKAAAELGRHPFPHPTGNLSQPYTNPLGAQLGACTYCGFCEKFGCGNYSKASPQTTILPSLMTKGNFTLKTECEVLRVELSSDRKRATGVTYVNSAGEEFFQPADLVILSAYILQNVRLLLLSGIGKPYDPKSGEGVVGKNYAYQTMSSVNVFFDDKILNPFIGAGALATVIDDFNGDNFDHGGLGFIGGAYIAGMVTGGRPIEMIYTPTGTAAWGMEWKHAAAKNYLRSFSLSVHGSCMSHRGNYLDLDPTYRDVHGRPMLRMTFDFTENEHKMSDYLTDRAAEVARAMNPREIKLNRRTGPFSVVPYQTTHNTGGAIMGDNPRNSVVNKFLQSWDVSNVFSMGAGAFPQNAGYNPTGTVAALAYQAAHEIRARYLKSPGPLVQA